ncbi:MAG: hypothetical protein ACPLYF_03425 [Fervidobacterium sp.]
MVKFSVRGGARLRTQYIKIKKSKSDRYECPSCSKKSVKRESAGQWECRSCGAVFAGGAYEFTTPGGVLARRLIQDLSKGKKLSAAELESIEKALEKKEERAESEKSTAGENVEEQVK